MSDAGRAAWRPRFEMSHRRLVPFDEALGCLTIPPGLEALYRRLLEDAGILDSADVTRGPLG